MDDVAKKKIIVDLVDSYPGIKGTQLAVKAFIQIYLKKGLKFSTTDARIDVAHLMETLVREGEILEIEYILPTADHRIKSIYFPKGTQITVPT